MRQNKNKVLINALNLTGQWSGVQNYIVNLLRGLSKIESPLEFVPVITRGMSEKNQLSPITADVRNRQQRILFENLKLHKIYHSNDFGLYHSTSYVLPYFWSAPSIVTVHDVIAFQFPELCDDLNAQYFKLIMRRSIRKASKIIAVSNKVKSDIIELFQVEPDRIKVISLGVGQQFRKIVNEGELKRVKEKYNLPTRYILFVGNIEPKKNLNVLLKAFKLVRQNQNINHKLLIVGRKAWKSRSVFDDVVHLRLENCVQFLGYVDEYDLPALYSMTDLFVFPSIYEGFGLPPLEAMACEAPVLVSSAGALPEVTGNICPQVDPHSVDNWRTEISNAITQGSAYSCKEAAAFAAKYKWENMVTETLKLYAEVLADQV